MTEEWMTEQTLAISLERSGRVEYTPVPLVVHLRASYQDGARSGSRQLQRLCSPPDSGQRYRRAAREEPLVRRLERRPRPLRGLQIVNHRRTHHQTHQPLQAAQS